ncbi:hypothetical protein DYB28_005861, partial [Aphanomyces astaci]
MAQEISIAQAGGDMKTYRHETGGPMDLEDEIDEVTADLANYATTLSDDEDECPLTQNRSDCGQRRHVPGNETILHDAIACKRGVRLADGHPISFTTMGDVSLKSKDTGRTLVFCNVLLVPDLTKTLISISRITDSADAASSQGQRQTKRPQQSVCRYENQFLRPKAVLTDADGVQVTKTEDHHDLRRRHTDTDEEVDAIFNHMQAHILLSDMGPVAKLLGMEIYRNEDEMTMDVLQVTYIERMAAKYGLASAKASAIGSNQASIQRTKHLALHFYFLWDLVKSRKFTLTHLPTNVMPADVFTKHVPKDKLKAAMAFMGMGGSATPTGAINLPPVPDDDDMGQDHERGFVYNAPALPDPPSFNGSSQSERRTFIRQYKKYLDQVNALQLNGSRPFVMPVSACMDVFTKKRAFGGEPQDLEVLKKRLTTAIRLDTTILDADSRIGKMLDNLMRALERDDQAWVLDQEGKTVVDIMVKAIKPMACSSRRTSPACTSPRTSSDVTLVTAGVMKSLERAGVEVKVISPEPSVIQPYGQAPALKVDRQVQFKLVTLDTPCGPLALRGLKAWVDSSSNAAELLISRAVMERLGFSEDELLSHAFAKQEVWDVSDVDKPSAMAS